MPSSTRLLGVEYRLRFSPSTVSEPEQQYERAEICLGHVMAFGRVLEHLSTARAVECCGDLPPAQMQERLAEIDHGINTLGLLIAAISGQAWEALSDLAEPQGGQS